MAIRFRVRGILRPVQANGALLGLLLLVLAGTATLLRAQVPAQPVDPNQAIPAQPVDAAAATPVAAASATDSTAAPETTGPSLAIIADGSLKAVLRELAQNWADNQPVSPQLPITLTNAGAMRAKIAAGSVWDLAIDADIDDTKALTDGGWLLAAGQRSLARNTLVIYGRAPLVKEDDLDWFDLIGTEWRKVALGNPNLTVSGRVARRALQKHDLSGDDHKALYIHTVTEAAALQVLQRQQADAAFIFHTDLPAVDFPGFQPFPIAGTDAPPIFYTAAIFRLAKNANLARSFLQYCTSEAARPIWTRYGFETD